MLLSSCGGLTRTDDLWVMSPTSYQLLHSAMFLNCDCKGTALFWMLQIFLQKIVRSALNSLHPSTSQSSFGNNLYNTYFFLQLG